MAADIGLGNQTAWLRVYTCNRPPLPEYESLDELRPAYVGEIPAIINATGNHWRKVFSLFAKLCVAVTPENADLSEYNTWQVFRDEGLLTRTQPHALLFSEPKLASEEIALQDGGAVHIIMGKTYADRLGLLSTCHWVDPNFAVLAERKIIVAPYFDYRQLSNIKLEKLVELINGFAPK